MTEHQQLVWALLSGKYPSVKKCENCINGALRGPGNDVWHPCFGCFRYPGKYVNWIWNRDGIDIN